MQKIPVNDQQAQRLLACVPEAGYAWHCVACKANNEHGEIALAHWRETGHGMPVLKLAPGNTPPGVTVRTLKDPDHTTIQPWPTPSQNPSLTERQAIPLDQAFLSEPRDIALQFTSAAPAQPSEIKLTVIERIGTLRDVQNDVLDEAVRWALAERAANVIADELNALEATYNQTPPAEITAGMGDAVMAKKTAYANACRTEGDAEERWKDKARRLVRLLEASS